MNLYKIEPNDRPAVHVVADSCDHAADVFVTWDAARDRVAESFTVETVAVDSLPPTQQAQVRSAQALGIAGLAHFDEDLGWTFDLTLWGPFEDEGNQPNDTAGEGARA